MSKTETEAGPGIEAPRPAERTAPTVFVGISGLADAASIAARAEMLAVEAAKLGGGGHFTLAYPGADVTLSIANPGVDLATYPMPEQEGALSPWGQVSAAQVAMLRQASEAGAQACLLLHPDLAAFTPEALERMLQPILSQGADLVLPNYAIGPYDGLLNAAILAPLTRALYGKRARFPLAPDFAVSARMATRLSMHSHRNVSASSVPLLWPTVIAAAMDAAVSEVPLPIAHAVRSGDMELSSVIAQLVGSIFADMETHAPLWQRVRSAPQHTAPRGPWRPAEADPANSAPVDTAPMINSFLLGTRSLQDVWGLVLPPVTLLDLKRITLMPAASFSMPDELWVRIVYDFALGYRLRTINRAHLLGALTPLYLGWVASYIRELLAEPGFSPEQGAERLARAFEEGKPYLVRRWRWPDRFNP